MCIRACLFIYFLATDREELVRELSKENTAQSEEMVTEMVSDMTTHEDSSTNLMGGCARMIPLSDIQLKKSQTRTYGPFVQTKLHFETPTVPFVIKQEKEDLSEDVVSDGVPPEMSRNSSKSAILKAFTIPMTSVAELQSVKVQPLLCIVHITCVCFNLAIWQQRLPIKVFRWTQHHCCSSHA